MSQTTTSRVAEGLRDLLEGLRDFDGDDTFTVTELRRYLGLSAVGRVDTFEERGLLTQEDGVEFRGTTRDGDDVTVQLTVVEA